MSIPRTFAGSSCLSEKECKSLESGVRHGHAVTASYETRSLPILLPTGQLCSAISHLGVLDHLRSQLPAASHELFGANAPWQAADWSHEHCKNARVHARCGGLARWLAGMLQRFVGLAGRLWPARCDAVRGILLPPAICMRVLRQP